VWVAGDPHGTQRLFKCGTPATHTALNGFSSVGRRRPTWHSTVVQVWVAGDPHGTQRVKFFFNIYNILIGLDVNTPVETEKSIAPIPVTVAVETSIERPFHSPSTPRSAHDFSIVEGGSRSGTDLLVNGLGKMTTQRMDRATRLWRCTKRCGAEIFDLVNRQFYVSKPHTCTPQKSAIFKKTANAPGKKAVKEKMGKTKIVIEPILADLFNKNPGADFVIGDIQVNNPITRHHLVLATQQMLSYLANAKVW